tara:strand:- start:1479 stop:2264 length:786 start_codon:yes stop_codon:yes gene_type:complete
VSTNNKASIISNPFVFIGIIALIASLILSFVSESTSERVDSNKKLDIMKNVLLCRYLEDYKSYEDKLSVPSNIEKEYDKAIEQVLYYEDGSLVSEDLDFSKLEWKENKSDGSMYFFFKSAPEVKYLPLFRVKGDNGYIIPVSGKGLWSTLKGFLYVSKDLSKIKGISFYSHTETPGLGGEIDKPEVKKRYVDKSIDLFGEEIRVAEMVKAPSKDNNFELQYMSGATITSDGLNYFIKRDLNKYKDILLCESDSTQCKGVKK